MLRFRVPTLSTPDIAFRVTRNADEIRCANELVFRSYVELGYWNSHEDLTQNRYLSLPPRHVIVVCEGSTIIGTVSVILDSGHGLPADSFEHEMVGRFRSENRTLAEISAFALAKDHPHQCSLVHFLMAFVLQYSFHYLAVDRFIAVCTPKHARFYERYYDFKRVNATAFYDYVKVDAQMLTLDLIRAYEAFRGYYEAADESSDFFRFLYVDQHSGFRFPTNGRMRRSRRTAWTAYATTYANVV